MTAVIVVLATVFNTVVITVIVRRLLGVAVGWPRTLCLAAIASLAAFSPLGQILEWIGIDTVGNSVSHPLAAVMVALLYGAWVLVVLICILAVAEAVLPTGSLPGPVALIRGLPGWLSRVRRYVGILGIAARHGLIRFLSRSSPETPGDSASQRDTATSLREALTQGGVTFVKLGQSLASRPDLLPRRYVEELSRLHSQVAPEPWADIHRTLSEELGIEPEQLFAEIDPVPLAAASVGQVHMATLSSGEHVVVKIQRTGARDLVRSDLDIIKHLAALTERRASWARRLGTRDLAAGFHRSLDEELDFRVELHNLATLRGSEMVVIPRAFPDHSSKRVLIMEQLHGVPLTSASQEIASLSPELRLELAEALVDVVMRQLFVDGIFHADLHGGNVLLLTDGRLGLLDFGSVGRMDRGLRTALVSLLLAVNRQDGAAAAARLTTLLEAPEDLNMPLLKRQMADLVMRVGGIPVEELLGQLFTIALDHRLRVPPPLAAAFRAIGSLEGTLRLLSPTIDVIGLVRERAGIVARAGFNRENLREQAQEQLVTVASTAQRLPEQLGSVVNRLDQPNFGIRLNLVADTHGERFLSGLVQQVVLAILTATFAACGTALVLSDYGPMLAPRLQLVTYAGLVLLLFAFTLGSRLIALACRGRYETAEALMTGR